MSLRALLRRERREPIHLLKKRHHYFPQRFMWRGKEHTVYTVERVWTQLKRKGAWHCFRVHCQSGTYDLFQDTHLNAWYLASEIH
jgi:hypothetical protein